MNTSQNSVFFMSLNIFIENGLLIGVFDFIFNLHYVLLSVISKKKQ